MMAAGKKIELFGLAAMGVGAMAGGCASMFSYFDPVANIVVSTATSLGASAAPMGAFLCVKVAEACDVVPAKLNTPPGCTANQFLLKASLVAWSIIGGLAGYEAANGSLTLSERKAAYEALHRVKPAEGPHANVPVRLEEKPNNAPLPPGNLRL